MIPTRSHASPRPTSAPWSLQRVIAFAFGFLLVAGAASQARAQEQAGDPPDRAARLSEVSGQVWLFSPESDEWIGVERNRPLTSGDRIATDSGARAEIALGTTTLRLDGATELEIVELDDARYVVQLQGGSVAAHLRNTQSVGEFELVTDEGRFRAQTVGRYRFDRSPETSELTVLAGQAVFENGSSALPLQTGQHAQFWLDASGAAQYSMAEPVRDDFASWNDERDRAESRVVASVRYVSPEMTGADDLDRYGRWEQAPEYGPVWYPQAVASGWAPYSAGHWAFVRPWGWTWVDDAPWGFAPFHYGRWVYHRNRWGWAPGTYVARPVYAPALVAWLGGGRGSISVSVGGPPVGWFPLAPHEVFVPGYRASPRYIRNVNFTHVTNVTRIDALVNEHRRGDVDRRDFGNRKFPHAVTVVPASVLTGRQPVGPSAARFRNDPQARSLFAGARPQPALAAPPVSAPPAPRPREGRPGVRPPFAGAAPGFAGRPGGGETPGRRTGAPGAVVPPERAGLAPRPGALPADASRQSRPTPGMSPPSRQAEPAPGRSPVASPPVPARRGDDGRQPAPSRRAPPPAAVQAPARPAIGNRPEPQPATPDATAPRHRGTPSADRQRGEPPPGQERFQRRGNRPAPDEARAPIRPAIQAPPARIEPIAPVVPMQRSLPAPGRAAEPPKAVAPPRVAPPARAEAPAAPAPVVRTPGPEGGKPARDDPRRDDHREDRREPGERRR